MRIQTTRSVAAALMLGALFAPTMALAQNELYHGPGLDTPASGKGNVVKPPTPPTPPAPPTPPGPAAPAGPAGSGTTGNGINYHNGPVMHNGVNIYYIWYGDWSKDSTANAILTDYARFVGGSSYFNINTSYSDTTGAVPNTSAAVRYVSSVADGGSLGTSLSDASIWTLVSNALKNSTLPTDPNGVYFVLTAPNVAETSGFLTQYCGWHDYNTYGPNSTPIKYAFVGNPAAKMSACAAQSTGPNGDAQADAMVSVIAHELEEAATDPQLNAWYDSTGQENADKCAWTFGTLYTANGAYANVQIGFRNYLIQRNWVNAGGGYCALSYTPTPDFSVSVSPGTQTVIDGQTSGSYTMSATGSNGWSGTVTYSVTAGLPAGATAHVTGNTITISTSTTTPAGNFSFTISGTDGTHAHTTSATLTVVVPTFTISLSPPSQTVKRPASGSTSVKYTVTVTAGTGYTGTVNLTVGGTAPGITTALSTASLVGGSGTSTLTVTVASNAKTGPNTLTVTGKDATSSKSATASLQVQ